MQVQTNSEFPGPVFVLVFQGHPSPLPMQLGKPIPIPFSHSPALMFFLVLHCHVSLFPLLQLCIQVFSFSLMTGMHHLQNTAAVSPCKIPCLSNCLFEPLPRILEMDWAVVPKNSFSCLRPWHTGIYEMVPVVCAFSPAAQQCAPLGFVIPLQ